MQKLEIMEDIDDFLISMIDNSIIIIDKPTQN